VRQLYGILLLPLELRTLDPITTALEIDGTCGGQIRTSLVRGTYNINEGIIDMTTTISIIGTLTMALASEI
jgi:hypothetical protein